MLTLILAVALSAAPATETGKAVDAYRASLEIRSAALQKELLSGKLSKSAKASKSAELKHAKTALVDLAKGKFTAEPFAAVAARQPAGTGPYKPLVGHAFMLTAADVEWDGRGFSLVYSAGTMSGRSMYRGEAAQAGQTVVRTKMETVKVPVAIKGAFRSGVYLVVEGPALERIGE